MICTLASAIRFLAAGVLLGCAAAGALAADAQGKSPGFRHCRLYVHACWLYNYPLATRTWNRQDYGKMFRLLRMLGYDQVMLWPMLEAIPMRMSPQDAEARRGYRGIVEDIQQVRTLQHGHGREG